MTSFLRFFILALTPLLAVTVSFGPAVLFGLAATLVLLSVAALVFFLRPTVKESALLWSVLGLAVVLVTLVDFLFTLWLPGVRAAWGLYLNLLAFSPLVTLLPLEKPQAASLGAELGLAFRTGLLLTLLFLVTALLREALGSGTLTLVPGGAEWKIPGLNQFPLTILTTGAGGFFLAAGAVIAYRAARPRLMGLEAVARFLAAGQESSAPAQAETGPAEPVTVLPETTDDWGEDLVAAVAALAGKEKRRLLVIGSGNGELAYYLSMLCLEQAKGGFEFRVREVDHFSTRIETAVKGVYRDHQIEFMPAAIRDAWMTRGQGEDRLWRVNNEPRLHVQFEVADFQQGPLFFPQPCHLIVLNQGIEYVSDDKKVHLLKTVCDNLLPGGALVVVGPFRRELLPEGMKRTGTSVFRKS